MQVQEMILHGAILEMCPFSDNYGNQKDKSFLKVCFKVNDDILSIQVVGIRDTEKKEKKTLIG